MSDSKHNATRLLELQELLLEFSEVERLIYFPDKKTPDRRENNTEHSYNLAVAGWFLSQKYPHLDKDLIIRYALVHDLVEIHAGDEQAIGRSEEAEQAKIIREHKALQKIIKDWPDFEDMINHINHYEARKDPESKFVYALDKVMPMLLNLLSEGKTWKKYNFNIDEVLHAKDAKIPISPEVNELWQVFRRQITDHKSKLFNQKISRREILFCTTNSDKFSLASKLLDQHDITVIQNEVEVDEIQSEDPEEIITHKARLMFAKINQPLIVTDDSWNIPALNGFPGPYMKSVNSWFTPETWVSLMSSYPDKRVFMNSWLAYIDQDGIKIFNDNQERVFLKTPSKKDAIGILKIVALPGDSTPLNELWDKNPDKLLKNRTLWEDFISWYKEEKL